MAETTIEVTLGAGPFNVKVLAPVGRLFGQPASNPVLEVPRRFVQLFEAHGVAPTQIPQLIPQLTLAQLRSPEALLPGLTETVLARTVELFQVNRKWLDGVEEVIYPPHLWYQDPQRFFEELNQLNLAGALNPVIAFGCHPKLDGTDDREQPLVLVLVEKLTELGGQEIHRYRICFDAWNWGYPKTRIQLKAMARLVSTHYRCELPLYEVNRTTLTELQAGRRVPQLGRRVGALEDYGLGADESAQAKESGELPAVMKYIQNHGLVASARRSGAMEKL